MKRIFALLTIFVLLFSMQGCTLTGPDFSVADNTLYIENSQITPRMTLIGDEEKEIKNGEFWNNLVEAIDGNAIKNAPVLTGELCECELRYTVRVAGTYPNGYYLTLHNHGVEISKYCKFRKCMDLLGIVEVDGETMSELISILEGV